MIINARILALLLAALLLCSLGGCGVSAPQGYDIIARLDSEQFSIAFRSGDPISDIVSAALEEIAAEGTLSRLSSQYLGQDFSCLDGQPDALSRLEVEIEPDRRLIVGVQDGSAPLCSKNSNGSYEGLIPDLVDAVRAKTGWEIVYSEIRVDNVKDELGSGNVDCAWLPAAFAESSDYSLSPAWMNNSHLLIVRRDSGINKMRDLKKRNIGVMDLTSENALKNNTKIYDSVTLWTYADVRGCFSALASGICDAVIIDEIVSINYLY